MPDLVLLTYADERYADARERLVRRAHELGCFDRIVAKTRAALVDTDFYRQHRGILDQSRGGGYWLWKPYWIIATLLSMRPGDVLLYVDSGDWLEGPGHALRGCVLDAVRETGIYLTAGSYRHGDWTKRDAFVLMGADTPEFHNAIQVEAGVIACACRPGPIAFLASWLHACLDPRALTDQANECGLPNLPGFREHRHDQSVLTNLAVEGGIAQGALLRPYVHCNRNHDHGR